MQTIMTLELKENRTIEIKFITSPMQSDDEIIIALIDDRPLSKIAAEFEECEEIVKTDNIRPDIKTIYKGYTELTEITRKKSGNNVRITLAKPKEAR